MHLFRRSYYDWNGVVCFCFSSQRKQIGNVKMTFFHPTSQKSRLSCKLLSCLKRKLQTNYVSTHRRCLRGNIHPESKQPQHMRSNVWFLNNSIRRKLIHVHKGLPDACLLLKGHSWQYPVRLHYIDNIYTRLRCHVFVVTTNCCRGLKGISLAANARAQPV